MYKVVIDNALLKKLAKLKKRSPQIVKMLEAFISELEKIEDPRSRGKAMSANLAGFWRYRLQWAL